MARYGPDIYSTPNSDFARSLYRAVGSIELRSRGWRTTSGPNWLII